MARVALRFTQATDFRPDQPVDAGQVGLTWEETHKDLSGAIPEGDCTFGGKATSEASVLTWPTKSGMPLLEYSTLRDPGHQPHGKEAVGVATGQDCLTMPAWTKSL
jgi:hypothetical protein